MLILMELSDWIIPFSYACISAPVRANKVWANTI